MTGCAPSRPPDAYEQARGGDARIVTDEQRAAILALATDFPRLWRDSSTAVREKKRFGVKLCTVHLWRRRGLLRAHPVNDRGDYLYEIPPEHVPGKFAHKGAYQAETRTTASRNARGAV